MYQEHPSAIPPEDKEAKIWKYMDFAKFISLLEEKALYFNRANNFEDPLEGKWPKLNLQQLDYLIENNENNDVSFYHVLKSFNEVVRSTTGVSCWHLSEFESMAMWKIYSLKNQGIAVVSTFERLRDSITDNDEVYIGVVNYYDPSEKLISFDQGLNPIFNKLNNYQFEKELRAISTIRQPFLPGDDKQPFKVKDVVEGKPITVKLETLIGEIILSPQADPWLVDLVKKMVIERYNLDINVKKSDVLDPIT